MNPRFQECITPDGPKKILTCDGGGILGMMSIEILVKLERELRIKLEKPELVLSDYFDFVCGTSTGAIIATCIACGMPMEKVRDFYIDSGADMFDKACIFKRLWNKFNSANLAKKMQAAIDEALKEQDPKQHSDEHALLCDSRIRTLLMIVMQNHSTDSPWPISNNPFAKYSDLSRKDSNCKLPLWQLVRASTAAPTYFSPERVVFSKGTREEYEFVFVDGGVTTYNNPAFLAFQIATASPYKLNWKTGVDDILIVSVGTGKAPKERRNIWKIEMWMLHHAKNVPSTLMNAASAGWDMACRTVGYCRFGAPIDNEFKAMVLPNPDPHWDPNWTGDKLFSYVRYDPDVTQKGLDDLKLTDIKAEDVQKMDEVKYIKAMQRVGKAYAEKYVDLAHLGSFV